jgi:hypothetical protein
LISFVLFLSIFTDLIDVIRNILLKNVYVFLSIVVAFMIVFFNFYSQDIQKLFFSTIKNKEETEVKTEIKPEEIKPEEIKPEEITKPIEEEKTIEEEKPIEKEKIPEVEPEIIKFDISMFQENL